MENKSIFKYIRYRRKSSEDNKERQAASLEEQTHELNQIEIRQKIKAVGDLEEAKSAHSPGREVFNTMMEKIAKGEVNAILTWHPNRLARNPVDGGHIVYLMDEGKLLEIRTPSRVYHNTPEDKFMLTLEFGISKKDSDDKSVAVHRGLDKKLRDGWRPGVAPEGYLNDKGTESGFRKVFTDPERMPFIKKIFELFYEGTPVIEIQRIAKDEWHYLTRQKKRLGGKPLGISTIYWILRNPFYCGKFEYPVGSGKWYEGKHEKAVSEEMFEAIQVKLGNRSPYKFQNHDFAFSGLMKCENCGSGIVAEEKWQCICRVCKLKFSITKNNKDKCTGCGTVIASMDNPTILHYVYYRCGKKKNRFCLEKSVRVDRIEEQTTNKLLTIKVPDCFLDWAIEQIAVMTKDEQQLESKVVNNAQQAIEVCKKKLHNLLQLKISPVNSDGSILSDEDYKLQKVALEQELKALQGEEVTDEKVATANKNTEDVIAFGIQAKQEFEKGNNKKKRQIFMGIGLHPTLKDRLVDYHSPKYIESLENIKKDIDEAWEWVAPNKQIDLASQMWTLFPTIPSVLRG